jgi:hypothetical protein
VVLSACNTASGQTNGGEALSGLTLAFLFEGTSGRNGFSFVDLFQRRCQAGLDPLGRLEGVTASRLKPCGAGGGQKRPAGPDPASILLTLWLRGERDGHGVCAGGNDGPTQPVERHRCCSL